MDIPVTFVLIGTSFLSGVLLQSLIYLFFLRPHIQKRYDNELHERKDQFISIGSHYLLNPITVIQTAIASLQDQDANLTPEKRRVFYEAIERGQQRLWILTEQLLLVGEIDQNDIRLKITVSDLFTTISGAIAAVDPFARAKRIRVHFVNDLKEQEEARFDSRRMKQAIIAVLDNAIKFSLEDTEILIRLSLQNDVFTLLVEDHGIGMPDELLSHLSEKFYRGTSIYSFDYEGFGLGLHVAQAIVRLHQGNISFESKLKRGTVVAIQWPNY